MTGDSEQMQSSRPFPWLCPSCGKKRVYPTMVPYTAEVKYDGLTHMVYIPNLETPKCKSCSELLISDSADEQIHDAFRSQVRLLSPTQIRQRRKQLGLSQAELAKYIGTAEPTISRWETGAMIQSRTNDNLLRLYFALPVVRESLQGEYQSPDLGLEDAFVPDSGQCRKDVRGGNCDDDCSKSTGQSDDHAALSLHFAVRRTGFTVRRREFTSQAVD